MTSNLILFPDFVTLQAEVERLRLELSILILERDDLVLVECPNIETAYMLALGNLEYRAYELNVASLRLKRKIDLIQAKVNRQEPVKVDQIEAELDQEFADYQRALDAEIERMNEALERNRLGFMSDADAKELKKLYRQIVKALHPDLRPDISDAELTLFHNAIRAYETGDLPAMQVISSMVSDPVLLEAEDSMSLLYKEKERLSGIIARIRESISEVKQAYPYNFKCLIQDEVAMSTKKEELEGTIASFLELIEIYKLRIKDMLGVK